MNLRYWIACCLVSFSAAAHADLSDAEAKRIAQKMQAAIEAAQKVTRDAIDTRDRNGYYKFVRTPLRKEVQAWPEFHRKNRAIFPYQQCYQAALDYIEYADTFFTATDDVRNRQYRDHNQKQFAKTGQACKASIKKPDMSLKDIQ